MMAQSHIACHLEGGSTLVRRHYSLSNFESPDQDKLNVVPVKLYGKVISSNQESTSSLPRYLNSQSYHCFIVLTQLCLQKSLFRIYILENLLLFQHSFLRGQSAKGMKQCRKQLIFSRCEKISHMEGNMSTGK